MNMEIKKKIWPPFFEEIKNGKKDFELRLADFEINEGDTLVLEEWDPEKKEYTGNKIEKSVKKVTTIWPTKLYKAEEIEKHGLHVIELND